MERARERSGDMELTAALDAPCPPEQLFAQVDDLARYPAWLALVARAEPVTAVAGDTGPAWRIDLRRQIGPLARSKRLRMVRAALQEHSHVRFERREDDGRSHSSWVLEVDVAPSATGSHLEMRLHYGGTLFGPVLERLLADDVEKAKPRLLALVS